MRRRILLLAGLAGLILLATLTHLAMLRLNGNFHAVSPGEVYRAAQMDGQALVRWHREHGIASILNLRGENPGADWYEAERAVATRLGIAHIDFRLSAQQQLTHDEVQRLIAVMRDAPKPMLIHCQAGADRTGLASALYVAAIEGQGEEAAEHQLSISYGHIGLPWLSKAWAMDLTWEEVEPLLGYPDS